MCGLESIYLEGSTHVLRPDKRPQLLGVNGLVDLGEEAGEVLDLMLAHGLALLGGSGSVVLEGHFKIVVTFRRYIYSVS